MTERLFSTLYGGTAIGGAAVIDTRLSDFLEPLPQALIAPAGFFVVTAGRQYIASREIRGG